MDDQAEDVVGDAGSKDDCILNALRDLNTSEVRGTDTLDSTVTEGGNQVGLAVTFKGDTVGLCLSLGDCSWYGHTLAVTCM